MVKKISKLLLYFLFFVFALMCFMPKTNAYYFLEKELYSHAVVVSDEEVSDKFYYLQVENLNISYKEIKSMSVTKVNFNLFMLYNSINFSDIELAKALSSFVPININHVEITYSVLNPLNIVANAEGEFGEAKAYYSIMDNSIHVDLTPSKTMLKSYKNTLRNLKKSENGEYTYDKSF